MDSIRESSSVISENLKQYLPDDWEWPTALAYGTAAVVGGYVISSFFFHYRAANTPNTPPGDFGYLPLIGNTLDWGTNAKGFVTDRVKKHGSTFKCHLMGTPTVVLTHPTDQKFISKIALDGNMITAPNYVLNLIGKYAVNITPEPLHKRIRVVGNKFFGYKSIHRLSDKLYHQMVSHVNEWETKSEISFKDTSALTFDALSLVLFGEEGQYFTRDELAEVNELVMTIWKTFGSIPGLPYPFGNGVQKWATNRLKALLEEKIVQMRAAGEFPEIPSCYLEALASDLDLTLEQVVQNIRVVILVGYETTSGAMMSLFYFYTKFWSTHTRKLRESISQDVSWDDARNCPNLVELSKCQYLSSFLKECLRLVPVILAGSQKVLRRDIDFHDSQTNKTYRIPKGWALMLELTQHGDNESLHPQGGVFDPAAALEQDVHVWGYGAKACMGKQLAEMELKLLAYVLCNGFKCEIVEGLDVQPTAFGYRCGVRVSRIE